ncbi:MAG: hypothetical protein ABIP48_07400 [Planctomycetota bacterium]
MPEKPIQDPRILEAIEACRPASDDLEDPALAFLAERLAADPQLGELFERLQRLDAAVTEAFREVPVPEGLAGRIKARLVAEPQSEGALGQGGPSDQGGETGAPQPVAEVVGPRRRFSRRWLLASATGVAIAALLIVAIVVRTPQHMVYDEGQVLEGAIDFFESDSQQGELVAKVPPPEAFPAGIDFGLSNFPQMRWRHVEGFLGRTGVAYDISRRGGPRANLYVVKCTVSGLPAGLPASPLQNLSRPTGNVSVSAWQAGELLYVLVVEGGPEKYKSYVPLKTWT